MAQKESVNELMFRYGVPSVLLVALASTRACPVYNCEVSEWRAGRPLARHKVEKLQSTLAQLIEMLNDVRMPFVNLRDSQAVRKALAEWSELRAADKKQDAKVPQRVFAVAAPLPSGARGMGSASVGFEDSAVEGSFETESD